MVSFIPSFFKKTENVNETKSSNTAPLIFFSNKRSPTSFFKDGPSFETLTKEGYQFNVISSAAINMRANAVASVMWDVIDKNGEPVKDHPLIDLIKRPNVEQGQADFFRELKIIQIIGGEVFIESVKTNRPTLREQIPASIKGGPKEIYVHRPDRFTIQQGARGPISFTFQVKKNEDKKVFLIDPNTMQSEIMHMKNCNPLDDFRGLSELISIGASIDTANAIATWNKTLIDNEARPSGILEATDPTRSVTEAEAESLKQKITERFAGKYNVGEPFVIGGGWTWKPLGMTVKDMDFLNMKHSVSRDIALGLGVPPLMLDIPGDSTFNNKAEAKQWFFEGPVMMDLWSLQTQFNRWLAPMYSDGVSMRFNLDSHPAFADKRMKLFDMVKASEVMTINERREKIGLPPLEEGGDVLLAPAVTADDESKSVKSTHRRKKPRKKATTGPGKDGHDHEWEDGDANTSTDSGPDQAPHNHGVNYEGEGGDRKPVAIALGGDPLHDHELSANASSDNE